MTRSLPCNDFHEAMSNGGEILRVIPAAAIPGAEVAIEYGTVSTKVAAAIGFNFDGNPAQVTASGRSRALVRVPMISSEQPVHVTTTVNGVEASSSDVKLVVGRNIISDVHPVANPAFHPTDGSLYVTRSGSRGEHVPVSIFRVDSDGAVEEFSGDILNPTGIAFGPLGRMYVTSRFDGTVYRVSAVREVVAFAEDLGIATGLAFNSQGQMFVGDRSGTIYRVNEIGGAEKWVEHEPSVSAYHLAFGADDSLYVTGPTVSSFDAITRFDEDGNASTFYRGLGRPQGLAFDRDGSLYVAASLRGRRGIVRISPDGSDAELVVAGMNVVGLAFGPNGELAVATNEAVYSLPLRIHGTLLD
jgi:sugar lactone lactonase YvrE